MEAFLNIKYKQVSVSDKYEDFLKFNGLNLIFRKAALTVNPVCVLTKEGDVYTLTMITLMKTVTSTFKLNEEFEEERGDGIKAKSLVTVEGNKMILVQTDANGKKTKTVREFSADKLVMTSTADGWDGECSRVFEKID